VLTLLLSISFLQVLSMILDHGVPPDAVNRHKQVRDPVPSKPFFFLPPLCSSQGFLPGYLLKNLPSFFYRFQSNQRTKISSFPPCLLCLFFTVQTPLMLAAMHGKIDCVLKLLQAGANVSRTSQLLLAALQGNHFFLVRVTS